MRVTSNMSADNSIYNIQQGRARLDKLQELTSSGTIVNRPSDDPINTRLLLDIGDKVRAGDQYLSNIQKATTWQKFTNSALTGMSDTMTLAKRLASSISSGSNDATARQNAVSQLQALKQQMVDMGNMQMGDQYIFGGANNTVQPFQQITGNLASTTTITNIDVTGLKAGMQVSGTGIPVGTVISAVTQPPSPSTITLSNAATSTATDSTLNIYAGDETALKIEIGNGTNQPMNIPGNQVFTGSGTTTPYGTTNIFKAFDDLIAAVNTNDVAGIKAGSQQLEDGARQINNAQSDVASRLLRLDSTAKMNENTRNTLMTVYSTTQNVDYAKLAVQLSQQQVAFEASLSATAKLSKLSLLDYM